MDLEYIINTITSYGQEYFSSDNTADNNSATLHGTAVKARKGNKVEELTCIFKEVPPFMLALIKELVKTMLDQQSSTIKKLKEDFKDELSKRDKKIESLQSEIRTHRNEQDALATYNRRENLKIQGVEYSENENTNEIVKDICK